MNCQEFRTKWGPDADEATLSHAAACDDCLRWIEALASEEEVLFMKDAPRPSPQLEERIMKAIYETATHPAVPPLSAAAHGHAHAPRAFSQRVWRRWYVWTGAAGFILAGGILALQAFQQSEDSVRTANQAASLATKSAAPEAASAPAALEGGSAPTAGAPASPGPATAAAPDAPVSSPAADAGSNSLDQMKAAAPANKRQEGTAATPPAAGAADALALRGKTPFGQRTAPASPLPAETKRQEPIAPADASAGTAAQAGNQPPAADQQAAIAMEGQTLAQPPAPETMASFAPNQQSITISTFTDVQAAAQASDLPVPEAASLPQGFALKSVSLRYESETSKAVTQISSLYQRGADVISLDVYRNDREKRMLSIPGTFAKRELFTIDGNQAIGVTHQPGSADAPDHTVHVILNKDGVSLYVIASAKGVSLEELIEVVKRLNWKKS